MAFSITFDKYKYVGPQRKMQDPNSYAFNPNWFNELVASRRYTEAYNYAKQYEFLDPREQEAYANKLSSLEQHARIMNTIYSRVPVGSQDDQAITFSNNILDPTHAQYIPETNKYNKQFNSLKRMLGSNNLTSSNAVSVGLKLKNEKQYGPFGIDLLAADNEANIDNFCKMAGYSREALERDEIEGVKLITTPDGHEIKFSKNAGEANKLLYAAYLLNKDTGISPEIIGYDGYDKPIENTFNPSETATDSQEHQSELLNQMFGLFNDADNRTSKIMDESKLDNQVTSTTLCGFISDDLQRNYENFRKGLIDHQTYTATKKELQEAYDIELRGMSGSQIEMYSNVNNKDGDEVLRELDTKDRTKLLDYITTSLKSDRVTYQAAQSGGRLGTMISIQAVEALKGTPLSGNYGKKINVFVPGLWEKQAQARINNNTTFKAMQEVGNMEIYGYGYNLKNGTKIQTRTNMPNPNDPGATLSRYFTVIDDKNGGAERTVTREEVARMIDQDLIMDRAVSSLRRRHTNNQGQIINKDTLRQEAKDLATKAVNSLYSDVMPLTTSNIFEDATIKSEDGQVVLDETNLPYDVYDKIKQAYSIYDYILKNLIYSN